MKLDFIKEEKCRLRLRPWTFDKDKEIVLKWIANVKITEGQWRIRAAFELNSQSVRSLIH